MALSDRNVVMKARQIEDAVSPTQVYNEPNTLFTANFVSEINRISAQIKNGQTSTELRQLPAGGKPVGEAIRCIRLEAKRYKGEGDNLMPPIGACIPPSVSASALRFFLKDRE